MHVAPTPCKATREPVDIADRLMGVLLGTAVGDALGLPMEGMRASAIGRLFPKLDRYRMLGATGFVSDDTEQSALVAQSLARHPGERERCVRAFRFALLGWFLRLPWGIGFGTLRACVRIAFGLRKSGVASAGNGAAMRAAIVGAFFFDLPKAARHEWSDALARVTHTDARAVEGARFVAELAARCVELGPLAVSPAVAMDACHVVTEPSLRGAIEHAIARSHEDVGAEAAAIEIGTTGFVLHSVAIATFCFLRFGHDPGLAVAQAVRAGGDTDSNAAIVGAWMGAAHGLSGLPGSMVRDLQSGPFGRRHLEALGGDLLRAREGSARRVAAYSWPVALVRNLALYPIVLLHAFRVVGRR